jgi:hypothetical protein
VLAFDLYFLAMSHYRADAQERLGNHAQALADWQVEGKECYDRAVRWVEKNRGRLPEY